MSKKITESNYTIRTKQDQLFTKINPNTNKSFFKNIPNVFKGRIGGLVIYKRGFGRLDNSLDLSQVVKSPSNNRGVKEVAEALIADFYRDLPSQAKRAWEGHPTPPWALINGGNYGTCYHYHTKPIVLPDSFSKVFETIYKTNYRNTNLF